MFYKNALRITSLPLQNWTNVQLRIQIFKSHLVTIISKVSRTVKTSAGHLREEHKSSTPPTHMVNVTYYQCCGSGSRPVIFWSLDPGWGKNPDPERPSQIIFPRAQKQFFGLKILKFFDADIFLTQDTGWKNRIRDKYPESATLCTVILRTVFIALHNVSQKKPT